MRRLLSLLLCLVLLLTAASCFADEKGKGEALEKPGTEPPTSQPVLANKQVRRALEEPYCLWDIPYESSMEEVASLVQEQTGIHLVEVDYSEIILQRDMRQGITLAGWPAQIYAVFSGKSHTLSDLHISLINTDPGPFDGASPENFEELAEVFYGISKQLRERYGEPEGGTMITASGPEHAYWDYPDAGDYRIDTLVVRTAVSENHNVYVGLFFRNIMLKMSLVENRNKQGEVRVTSLDVTAHSPAYFEEVMEFEGWNGSLEGPDGAYPMDMPQVVIKF